MNKSNLFKRYLYFLLISAMLLTLFSCNATDAVNKANQSDTEITDVEDFDIKETYIGDNILDYEIQENDGEYYIVFDDISMYIREPSSDIFSMPVTWINFNQNEFQNKILNGKLLHIEKNIIADHFDKVEHKVIIPNPYNVYSFTHPTKSQTSDRLTLSRTGYGYLISMDSSDLNSNTNIIYWNTSILTKKSYNDYLDTEFSQFISHDSIEFAEEKTLSDGNIIKLSESFITANNFYKTEKFVISDSTKTMFVKKLFCPDEEYVTVFILAIIHGDNGDIYCKISSDTEIFIDALLTDEFLFGFDVEAVEKT